jgi:hypothetical protein
MRPLAILCLIIPQMFAAQKERDWKTGTVTAHSSISSEYTTGADGPHHNSVDRHILIVKGDNAVYTAEEKRAWDGWCLLIQSDQVKYAQDGRKLYVVDADGRRCTLDIVDQGKRP